MTNRSPRPAIVAVVFALIFVAGCQNACKPTPPQPPPQPPDPSVSVSSYDAFNKDLARRVANVLDLNGSPDFQVVVTPVADPIGTLYRKGRSVAVDDKACAPATEPAPRNMPSVFPSYELDAKLAAELGIDDAVLKGAATVGAKVAMGSAFSFSVLNAQLKALTDAVMGQILSTKPCSDAVKGEMVLVRGYVTGQRRFSAKADSSGKIKVGVAKVGKFDVEGSDAGVLSITDTAAESFLQIVSSIAPPPLPAGGNASPSLAPIVTTPTAITGRGQIYIQQDRADDARHGTRIAALLRKAGFDVEARVERTASSHTPDSPQVRYFNAGDKDEAAKVLGTIKQTYPEAVLVPLSIPAPAGQLEVWLPRVKPVKDR